MTLVILLIALTLCVVESANILAIFPTASYSHQMPLLSVARSLARRGHNLTVITTNPTTEKIPNYTEIDISFSYEMWRPPKNESSEKPLINLQQRLGPVSMIMMFKAISGKSADIQLNSAPIQNFMKYVETENPKYDLFLHEDLMHTAFLGFLPKVGNPILVSLLTLPTVPCGLDVSRGNPCNPSYVPDILLGFTNKMSFFERLQNFLFMYFLRLYVTPAILEDQEALKRKHFGFDYPTAQEIALNRSLLLLSNTWLLSYPRPIFPNVIMLGPLHIGETKPLPKDLETWIQGAEDGVVYFSLGSNMRSASLEVSKRNAILATFKRFPNYRIIWKWEEEELPGLPKNVICRKWLPQHDLLASQKIKLFINQGGLQSLQESIYFEVPMIGIPFFADQDYNVKIVERRGLGTYVLFEDLSEETLYNKMRQILYNETYMETVKRVSSLLKTQMLSPRDSAVWWIEYVIKSGGHMNHLKGNSFELSWFQLNGYDVFLTIFTTIAFIFYVIYKLINKIFGSTKKSKVKKQKTK